MISNVFTKRWIHNLVVKKLLETIVIEVYLFVPVIEPDGGMLGGGLPADMWILLLLLSMLWLWGSRLDVDASFRELCY